MPRLPTSFVLLFLLSSWCAAETGTFEIHLGGKKVGQETWTDEDLGEDFGRVQSCKVEMTIPAGAKEMKLIQSGALTFVPDSTDPKLFGLEVEADGQVQSVKLTCKKDEIEWKLKIGDTEKTGTLEQARKNLLVLENNAVYRFRRLAMAAPANSDKKTEFKILSPNLLQIIDGSAQRKGPRVLQKGEQTLLVNFVFVTLGPVGVHVYLDGDNQLIRVDNPLQQFKAGLSDWIDAEIVEAKQIDVPDGQFKESDHFVAVGEQKIAGTLTVPTDSTMPHPLVLLLNGSGAQDRNGNLPDTDTMAWNVQRDLAHQLAAAGYASYRYDDRGIGDSTGNHAETGLMELVADAVAAAKDLAASEKFDSIYIAGHSEGGVVGILVAEKFEEIAGLILLATPSDSLDALLLRQVRARMEELDLEESAIEDAVARQKNALDAISETAEDWCEISGKKMFTRWLRDHMEVKPLERLAGLETPTLVIQGMKDRQVFPDQADAYEKLDPEEKRIHVLRFDNLDHLLMPTTGGIEQYADNSRAIDPQISEAIGNWLSQLGESE